MNSPAENRPVQRFGKRRAFKSLSSLRLKRPGMSMQIHPKAPVHAIVYNAWYLYGIGFTSVSWSLSNTPPESHGTHIHLVCWCVWYINGAVKKECFASHLGLTHLTSVTRGRVGVKGGVALDLQSGVITQVHSTCEPDIFVAKIFSRLDGLPRRHPSLDTVMYSINTTVTSKPRTIQYGARQRVQGWFACIGRMFRAHVLHIDLEADTI